ncbi:MAG: DUF4173 domain-containing protein [Chloroflexota bacterium]|nr:DUF4173 domain-containing protein [Chloroflexota bacterium]
MQHAIDPLAAAATVTNGTDDALPSIESLITDAPERSDTPPPRAKSDADSAAQPDARRGIVAFAVIAGLIIGLIGNGIFFAKSVGISFPLFVGICAGAAMLALHLARKSIRLNNALLLAPLAFFAVMVAIRVDALMTMLNFMAVLWLGALFVYYAPLRRTFDTESLGQQMGVVLETAVVTTFVPLTEVNTVWKWLHEHKFTDSARTKAVVRGALLTLPILAVFGLLLASADAIFDDLLLRLSRLFNLRIEADLFIQVAFIGVLAWFAAGALIFAAARRWTHDDDILAPPLSGTVQATGGEVKTVRKTVKSRPLTLGMIEAGMILGSLNALFGLFVAIQFAYFFGGRETLLTQGLTYSQYARRGFFELVAVAVLTIGLALFLDWTTIRHGKRENRAFQALIVVMVALNLVMLASAAQRMWLYEEAFGFTQLRVYVHVAIAWMGALFIGLVAALFRLQRHVFSLAIFVTVVGYGAALNLMNVELYIAERNIARLATTEQLDMLYLWSLSADAAPAFIDLFQTTTDEETRYFAGQWLTQQVTQLMRDDARSGLFSAHAGRAAALATIEPIRAQLPPLDWRYYPPGQYVDRGLYDDGRETPFDTTSAPLPTTTP